MSTLLSLVVGTFRAFNGTFVRDAMLEPGLVSVTLRMNNATHTLQAHQYHQQLCCVATGLLHSLRRPHFAPYLKNVITPPNGDMSSATGKHDPSLWRLANSPSDVDEGDQCLE